MSETHAPTLDQPQHPKTLRERLRDYEREIILEAYARHNYKLTPTARELGVSRPTLYDRLHACGLKVRGRGAH